MPNATNKLMRKQLPPQQLADGQGRLSCRKQGLFSKFIPNCFSYHHITGFLRRNPVLFFTYLVGFYRRTWVKTLACILSFCILFSSVAPAYGEALSSAQASRSAVGSRMSGSAQAGVVSEGSTQTVAVQRANVEKALEFGISRALREQSSMSGKLAEVKEIINSLSEAEDIVPAVAVYGEYPYGSVDTNKAVEVDKAFEHWYGEFLATHEMSDLIEQTYPEAYQEGFEKLFDEKWSEKSEGMDKGEYERIRQEAYEWHRANEGDAYK